MTPTRAMNGVRVEQAERVLPNVDIIAPLRALVIATSRVVTTEPTQITVGKRSVRPDRLVELIPETVARFSAHLVAVSELAVIALAAEAHRDTTSAVRALLKASELEVDQGREAAAAAWVEHALDLAETALDRRAEADALLVLAELDMARGAIERAARSSQRAYAIAEAARTDDVAATACLLLGRIALERDTAQGAMSWFSRGLALAHGDTMLGGRLELAMGETLARRGERSAAAARLRSAEHTFRAVGDQAGVAAALATRAHLADTEHDADGALVLFREAIAVMQRTVRASRDASGELAVRLQLCEYFLAQERLRDAEDEARRAEEIAIVYNHARELARIYLVLGAVRTAQRDEIGLVFFEKAIELSRGPAPSQRLEADAYHAYAQFCGAIGFKDEAVAYATRARELRELADITALS